MIHLKPFLEIFPFVSYEIQLKETKNYDFYYNFYTLMAHVSKNKIRQQTNKQTKTNSHDWDRK